MPTTRRPTRRSTSTGTVSQVPPHPPSPPRSPCTPACRPVSLCVRAHTWGAAHARVLSASRCRTFSLPLCLVVIAVSLPCWVPQTAHARRIHSPHAVSHPRSSNLTCVFARPAAPAIMSKEIEYAVDFGISFWAFCAYPLGCVSAACMCARAMLRQPRARPPAHTTPWIFRSPRMSAHTGWQLRAVPGATLRRPHQRHAARLPPATFHAVAPPASLLAQRRPVPTRADPCRAEPC